MPDNVLKTRIQHKIDTTANWTTANTVLRDGEIGLERTTGGNIKIKIGDGVTGWNSLGYAVTESSGQGQGSSEGAEEIYIGTTQPEGYKIWINPEGDEPTFLEAFYPTFTIGANDAITTTNTYTQINTEYTANNIVTAKIVTSTGTIFAPLLKYVPAQDQDPAYFMFGAPDGEDYKIVTIDSTNTLDYSTLELGGGGINFTVGDNMLLDNGELSARYGHEETDTGTLYDLITDTRFDSDGIDDVPEWIKNSNLEIQQLMFMTDDETVPFIPVGEDFTVKITYESGEPTILTGKLAAIPDFPAEGGYIGSSELLAASMGDSTAPSAERIAEMEADPDLYTIAQIRMDGEINILLIFAQTLFKNEPMTFEIEGQITTYYKIPATALKAGKDININPTTGAIGVQYGEQIGLNVDTIDGTGITNADVSPSYRFGSLHAWAYYHEQGKLIPLITADPPDNLFEYRNDYKVARYKDGEFKQFEKFSNDYGTNISTPSSQYDYKHDNYQTIPYYYFTPGNYMSKTLDNCLITLYQQPSTSYLYTLFASYLGQTGTNVFFAGTYNTNNSIDSIFSNGEVTPQNEEPALVLLMLYNFEAQILYFVAYSNESDLNISEEGMSAHMLYQLDFTPQYKNIPPSYLNTGNCTGNSKSIILGHDNKGYLEGDDPQILIGSYLKKEIYGPALILGRYNQGTNEQNYFEIGNGDSSNPHSIFKVNQSNIASDAQNMSIKTSGTLELEFNELKIKNGSSYNSFSPNGILPTTTILASNVENPIQSSVVYKQFQKIIPSFESYTAYLPTTNWFSINPQTLGSYSVFDSEGKETVLSCSEDEGMSDYIEVNNYSWFSIEPFMGMGAYTGNKIYCFDMNHEFLTALSPTSSDSNSAVFDPPQYCVYIKAMGKSDGSVHLNYPSTYEETRYRPKRLAMPDGQSNSTTTVSYISDTSTATAADIATAYNDLARKFNELLYQLNDKGYIIQNS